MDPLLPLNPPPSPTPPPAAANEDSAIITPSAGNKRRIGGAPNRQSYSHFTKVSLVKRFQATHQKSYSKYLQRLTPSPRVAGNWNSGSISNPPTKDFSKMVGRPRNIAGGGIEFGTATQSQTTTQMRVPTGQRSSPKIDGRNRGTVNSSIASQSNGNCGTSLAAGPLVYCQQWMDAKIIRERMNLQLNNDIASKGN